MLTNFNIKTISDKDRYWIRDFLNKHWGSAQIVSRGKLTSADKLPGFIAYINKQPVGLITYLIKDSLCEIISLDSEIKRQGIGSSLVDVLIKSMKNKNIKRVWLITTNDNLGALAFYKKIGFKIVATHKNAMEQSRKLKPQIPLIGINGIPIKDEIELEFLI